MRKFCRFSSVALPFLVLAVLRGGLSVRGGYCARSVLPLGGCVPWRPVMELVVFFPFLCHQLTVALCVEFGPCE